MKYHVSIFTLALLSLALNACSKKKQNTSQTKPFVAVPAPSASPDGSSQTETAANENIFEGDQNLFLMAQNVLQAHCISCHSSFHNQWSELATEQDWISAMGQAAPLINLNSPEQSLLLQRTQGYGNASSNMPLANDNNSEEFTSSEYETLQAWILSIRQVGNPSANQNCETFDESLVASSIKALNEDEFFNTINAIFSVDFSSEEIRSFNLPFDIDGEQYQTNSELRVLRGISSDSSVLDDLYPSLSQIAEDIITNIQAGDLENDYLGATACPLSAISDTQCRTAYQSQILSKAFRRSIPNDDYVLSSAESAYEIFLTSEQNPTAAFIHSIVSYVIFSPEFLFQAFRGSNGNTGFTLSNSELAHKIAYLFWGEPADEQLLSVNWQQALLNNNDSLETELTNLISNKKSRFFITNFLNQWLGLNESPLDYAILSSSDKYDSEIKTESELFIRNIILENAPASAIMNADYTYLNESLANYYQVSINNLGSSYQKINLSQIPELANRRGLFTQANYLSVGRKSDRPGSVSRGVTLLTRALCQDLGVPSGETPDLSDIDRSIHTETDLFRMVTETPGSTCVACHASINPVSFTFEVFDKDGRHPFTYRNSEGSVPEYLIYDSVGIANHPLANGPTPKSDIFFLDQRSGSLDITNHHGHNISGDFNDHMELLSLFADSTAFSECLTDHLYDYIIGTEAEKGMHPSLPENADQHHAQTCSKRDINQNSSGLRDIILNILKSDAFISMRRN